MILGTGLLPAAPLQGFSIEVEFTASAASVGGVIIGQAVDASNLQPAVAVALVPAVAGGGLAYPTASFGCPNPSPALASGQASGQGFVFGTDSPVTVLDGDTHLLSLVVTGPSPAGGLAMSLMSAQFFLDGAPCGTATLPPWVPYFMLSTTEPVLLGAVPATATAFDGEIYLARLWTVPLTVDEVLNNYRTPPTPDSNSPFVLFDFAGDSFGLLAQPFSSGSAVLASLGGAASLEFTSSP